MSRRAHSLMPPPPLERDVVMGPPPLPVQTPLATSISQNAPSKDSREYVEKYYKLKRKYFDLEEKHKEMEDELRRSGERNLRMNQERGALLDRILELESLTNGASSNQANPHAPLQPPSTAFPRSLISTRAQTAFASNLREAVEELDTEDTSVDPLLTSRHVGPQARKRREEEMKERAEEEAREARKTSKRKGGPSGAISGKGKDIGAPLTFAPGPSPSGPSGGTSQTLVSTSGKRIRIKPPAPAQAPPDLPPHSSHPGPEGHHTSQFVHNAGIPISLPPVGSPGSPLSSLPSDGGDHYMGRGASHLRSWTGEHGHSSLTSEYMMSVNSSNPSDIQRHAKPKRLKAHTVTSKCYSIPTVPRDRKNRPLLPLNVGIMTVISLGEVCMREHFHTERYIFPVGYEVTRRYLSARDPNAEVVYHCTILDGGDGPKFQIVANDMPDKPIIAGTATGAWSVVVRAANHVRNRQHSNSVSGPDFFGLGQNTIKHLIQELPNADRLKDYVWQHFTEGGPLGGRHAAVIPALPEDYDSANNSTERQESKGSADYSLEGDVPMSDIRVLPPEHVSPHPYAYHERRGSRASNGIPEDLPPPPSAHVTSHSHSHSPPMHREAYGHGPLPPLHTQVPPHPRAVAHGHHHHRHPHGPGPSSSHSDSRSPPYTHQPLPSLQAQSPYLANSPPAHAALVAPPPVPPTFASIMNAYPAPPYAMSPRPGTASDQGKGGSASHHSGSVSGDP